MTLDTVLPLIIGMVVIAGIMAFLLWKVLSSQSNFAIKRLQRINEDNLKRELELKRKLDQTEKQYQQKMDEAAKEAKALKEKIETDAMAEKHRLIESTEREKEAVLLDAQDEVAKLKTSAALAMDQQSIYLAEIAIRKTLTGKLIDDVHHHLIDAVIENIRSRHNLAVNTVNAEISSPIPLTADQKKALTDALNDSIGGAQGGRSPDERRDKKLNITEHVDHDKYIAGVYIKIGDLVIDGTLSNRLKQVINGLKPR